MKSTLLNNHSSHITINTQNAPRPLGPYVQAINAGGIVFVSGQIGIYPDTKKMPKNIYDQTYQSLQNIRNIINTAGLKVINLIKITLFIIDINDLSEINISYNNFFNMYASYNNEKVHFPARSCVEVTKLPQNAKIEIEAIAIHF